MVRQGPCEAGGGKGRCVGSLWDTLGPIYVGHLGLTIGYLKATVVHISVTLGHLRVTIGIGHLRVTIGYFCVFYKQT